MKKMRLSTIVGLIGIGGVVVATTSLLMKGPDKSKAVHAAEEAVAANRIPKMDPVLEDGSENKVAAVAEPQAHPWITFKYQSELKEYELLKTKIFLSEKDKVTKADLLKNADFTQGLQTLLQKAATDDESQRAQNAALDFLLEALESSSQEAAQVLQAIVQDPTIENSDADLASRKSLAGIKAEILFEWSALDPQRAAEMESWLPGPVSQKIWANVREQQENNLAESALELRR